MRSNYSAARENLEKAYERLQGDDETSEKMREAIGVLIDAMVVMQFKRKGQVLTFPPKQRDGFEISGSTRSEDECLPSSCGQRRGRRK